MKIIVLHSKQVHVCAICCIVCIIDTAEVFLCSTCCLSQYNVCISSFSCTSLGLLHTSFNIHYIVLYFIIAVLSMCMIYLTVPGVVKVSVTTLPINTEVLITWDTPSQPNGIIVGYQVIYSVYNSDTTSMSGKLNSSTRSYTIMSLS